MLVGQENQVIVVHPQVTGQDFVYVEFAVYLLIKWAGGGEGNAYALVQRVLCLGYQNFRQPQLGRCN